MKVLRALLALGYPFLVFAGLQWLEPRTVALALGAVLGLRAATRGRRPTAADLRPLLVPGLLVGGVLLLAGLRNDARFLLFVPAAVNGVLLAVFARTLGGGPTLVESLARLQVPDLPEAEVRYCRTVTGVWCVFFAANALACLWLALRAELWTWTLYTGFVAYLLVGLLFAVEFVVRSWRFGRYGGTIVEPLFRRFFPPPPAP